MTQIRHLLILLALLSSGMAGCSEPSDTTDLVPLEYTYIRIGQDQYSTGAGPIYESSIAFPTCVHNANRVDITIQDGYQIFQRWGPPHAPGLRLVKESDSGPRELPVGFGLGSVGTIHNVLVNETVEGNSTDYTIHLWHEILNPDPVHRVDRWFNMTFTPYGPSDTTYTEGEPC